MEGGGQFITGYTELAAITNPKPLLLPATATYTILLGPPENHKIQKIILINNYFGGQKLE